MAKSERRQFLVLAADIGETGGIGTAMRDFVRVLVTEYGGENCHVMSVRRVAGQDNVGAHLVDRGATTSSRRVSGRRQLRFITVAVAAAWRYRHGLVVVAAHPHLAPVAWASAALARAPFVTWAFGKESWVPLPILVRAAMRRSALVLAITEFTARHAAIAQALRPDQVRVVHLAVSSQRTSVVDGIEKNPHSVLTVSRLNGDDKYKGVDTLLRIWPRVQATIPTATLVVVGDGDDRLRMEREVAASGLRETVRFEGRLSERALNQRYASSAVFALPGRCRMSPPAEGEGFGLVFIEAAAAGLPVIAGRAGGVPEAVLDRRTGLLVDPENDAEVIDAIVSLLQNEEMRQLMGREGKVFVAQRFSFAQFVTAVLEVMDDASSARRRRDGTRRNL